MTINPAILTAEDLAQLQVELAQEQERRNATSALAAEYARLIDRIREDAEQGPTVPFEPLPQWDCVTGHAPGARITYGNGTYVNAGRCYLATPPPGSTDWEPITEPTPEPEPVESPDENEEEPTDFGQVAE